MRAIRALLAGVLLAMGLGAGARAQDRPVVVELFTSQGCSSCPPAEAVLAKLAERRGDVLALAFHVDCWERLGWTDPYSSPEATGRQRAYAASFGSTRVYTPQMVIDGRRDVVGSNRLRVLAAIDAAAAEAVPAVPLRVARDGEALAIAVGAGTGSGRALLVSFDPRQETAVPRGENAGRTIAQANVVRSLAWVAEWEGQAITFARPVPPGEEVALILQASGRADPRRRRGRAMTAARAGTGWIGHPPCEVRGARSFRPRPDPTRARGTSQRR